MTRPIVLTAGGTGGHVFPAEALAAELAARGHSLMLVTDKRGQGYGGTLGRIGTYPIPAGGLAGRGPVQRIGALANLGLGFAKALAFLLRLRPAAVVGFGGYASVPAMLAAPLAGIPTILHEQNAVLGRANRLLAPRTSAIATSHAQVAHLAPGLKGRVTLTGMPVREAVLARRGTPYPALGGNDPIRVLILGGSQGATILSEVVPAAMARLPQALKARLRVAQQCRPEDIEAVRALYAEAGIEARLETFFHDVPDAMASAHLIISRAGASSVAEITAIGRPSILVPYLHAVDDHQSANAHAIDDASAGWLMPQKGFTPESLATRLETLFTQAGTLSAAAACALAAGVPDAAKRLADLVEAVARPETRA